MALFTPTSVAWADKIVAFSSSCGVVKSSSQYASGYRSSSALAMRLARSF
ncbi:MAG: hypothetical protein AAFV77_03985 [Planctomycetota bacterium]